MAVHLRYCPACREEYQPHMVQCIECGTALKDMLEDEAPEYDAPPVEQPLLPPGEYRPIAADVDSATASALMRKFRKASLPLKVEAHGYGMRLSARSEDVAAAVAILVQAGVLEAPAAEAAEEGRCPACGTDLQGAPECPECGLQLAATDDVCARCGTTFAAAEESCPSCGQPAG